MAGETGRWVSSLEARGYSALLQVVAKRARASDRRATHLAFRRERERLLRRFHYEREARGQGHLRVAGVDEVGRGCLAGPVVAAAVILRGEPLIPCLDDSKCLSESLREALFPLVSWEAEAMSVCFMGPDYIDQVNILRATQEAMRRALQSLPVSPGMVLVDGDTAIPGIPFPQRALKKGDALSASISAASVIAKVLRDHYMMSRHGDFPPYNFRQNKGYGTREHWEAIRTHGPCPIHRGSFLESLRQVTFDF
ncbi:MAG: ribonuclease HII [Bacillota bacterium]